MLFPFILAFLDKATGDGEYGALMNATGLHYVLVFLNTIETLE